MAAQRVSCASSSALFRIDCILSWKAPRGGTTVELRLYGNDDQSYLPGRTSVVPWPRTAWKRSSGVFVTWVLHRTARPAPPRPQAPPPPWRRSGPLRRRRIDQHTGDTWRPKSLAASTNVATTLTLIAEGGRAAHRMPRAYPVPHSKRSSRSPLSRIALNRSSGVFVNWILHRTAMPPLFTKPDTHP
jgi:hypothetical protein